jgi:hypothetical protein
MSEEYAFDQGATAAKLPRHSQGIEGSSTVELPFLIASRGGSLSAAIKYGTSILDNGFVSDATDPSEARKK